MKILDLRAYYGSNIYCYRPVIKIILDLAPDGCRPTSELGDFQPAVVVPFARPG